MPNNKTMIRERNNDFILFKILCNKLNNFANITYLKGYQLNLGYEPKRLAEVISKK